MRITVKGKLFLAFGTLIVMMMFISGMTYIQLNKLTAANQAAVESLEDITYLVEKEVDHLAWLNNLANSFLLGSDFTGQLDHTLCDFGKWYYALLQSEEFKQLTPEIQEAFLALEKEHTGLHRSAQDIVTIRKGGDPELVKAESLRIYQNETQVYIGNIREGLNKVGDLLTEEKEKLLNQADSLRSSIFTVVFSIATLVLIIGSFVAFVIAKDICRSVLLVSQTASKIAEGDLSVQQLEVKSNDELGDMGKAFNNMIINLRNLVSHTSESAQQVAASSHQLSAITEQSATSTQQVAKAVDEMAKGHVEQTRGVNQTVEIVEQFSQSINQISQGAQEQSANVVKTTEMIEIMTELINDVAARSEEVKRASEQNQATAEAGGEAVTKAVDGMDKVKKSVLESVGKMEGLKQQSAQIGEIIEVIDEIAEQTNLLALNAAIEAARAGEHGKGFAVVADEVRKLAERSGKATKEIANLINSIQKETDSVARSMDQGKEEVEIGAELSKQAGAALKEIQQNVKRVGQEVAAISLAMEQIRAKSGEVNAAAGNVAAITQENTAATEEMSAGSVEVSRAMQSIAAIAQQSAASAEELTASTEEMTVSNEEITQTAKALSAMAQDLQAITSRFKV